jgi:hypothetical protein
MQPSLPLRIDTGVWLNVPSGETAVTLPPSESSVQPSSNSAPLPSPTEASPPTPMPEVSGEKGQVYCSIGDPCTSGRSCKKNGSHV